MSLRMSKKAVLGLKIVDERQAQKIRKALAEKPAKLLRRVISKSENTPQHKLYQAICARWPGQAEWEYKNAVPGRRFRVDICFPSARLAIEVDGWQYHGKYLDDFKRDREKQNLLTIHGWRILRFTASDINTEIDQVLTRIDQALNPDSVTIESGEQALDEASARQVVCYIIDPQSRLSGFYSPFAVMSDGSYYHTGFNLGWNYEQAALLVSTLNKAMNVSRSVVETHTMALHRLRVIGKISSPDSS